MRATHLAAHARSHMDPAEKPFPCTYGCDKAFWTAQHLRRHIVSCHASNEAVQGITPHELEEIGGGATSGLYRCTECERLFPKRKHLRQHLREVHADPQDPNPFPCTHPGCTRRFPTYTKRQLHLRVHDKTRYMCTQPHRELVTFSTWLELQKHVRECHPPQCPRPECAQSFASRENLRKHMRIHERNDRARKGQVVDDHAGADDAAYSSDDGSMAPDPDEAASWRCTWNGCNRVLSSPYALKVHVARVHRREKPFVCDACGQRYGYKHLLRQHMRRTHEQELTAEPDTSLPYLGPLLATEKRRRAVRERILPCPWDQLAGDGAEAACSARFSRLYDLRRHMESVHALCVREDELAQLFPDEVEQLPKKRGRCR